MQSPRAARLALTLAALQRTLSRMIADIDDLGPVDALSCDVCIVGSGAAGITLAREFIGTRHAVILLEGGGATFESASQDPYQSAIVGLKHDGIHNGRVRALGGTTTLWPGQSIPLWECDFQKRDWVPYSGWPLCRSSLQPYFDRAADVLGIPRRTFEAADLPDRSGSLPVYGGDAIATYYSEFAPIPNFWELYGGPLIAAPNVRILTHANAVALDARPDASAVTHVRVRSFQGKSLAVAATVFIVCCGGIESARLLLVSDAVERNGIGNSRGNVGRFFQDHPGVAVPVKPLDRKRLNLWYESFRRDNVRYCVKFAASEALQRREGILHVGGEVFYPLSFAVAAAKLLAGALHKKATVPGAAPPGAGDAAIGPSLAGRLKSVSRRIRQVGKTAFFRRYVLRTLSMAGVRPHVGFAVEQQPNPDSRITLSRELDSLGMRRGVLDWRLGDAEGRSIAVFAQVLADEWLRAGVAQFKPDDLKLPGREKGEHGGFIDASHHMGTTRMGVDPATSVVDPDCRVHGYDNLYIGGSSVFPTSGFSNPTFTLLALCLRMSDQIKARLDKASGC